MTWRSISARLYLQDYVHRVGRTGRAGNKGTAVTFISQEEERFAPDLVKAMSESKQPVPADLQTLVGRCRLKPVFASTE
jgi:superfamily II DNA/RNA helicase